MNDAATTPDRSLTRLVDLIETDEFVRRHIGPSDDDVGRHARRDRRGVDRRADRRRRCPPTIRSSAELRLPDAVPERRRLDRLRALAASNAVVTSLIGMGYSGTITPPVIARNVLENPAWYTAYTPYQPEISQGRLEALLNFQTMVDRPHRARRWPTPRCSTRPPPPPRR